MKLEKPGYKSCCYCAWFHGAFDFLVPREIDGKDASYWQSSRGVCAKPDCIDVSETPEDVFIMFTDYDEEACECFVKSKENNWSEVE